MCDALLGELRRASGAAIQISEDSDAVDSADKVLLLLSEGALRGVPLTKLLSIIAKDRASQEDRLVMVCRTKEEGWRFDKTGPNANAEVRDAPREVQAALNDHEAITYRAPNSNGASRHEFPAMLEQLLRRLLDGKAGVVLADLNGTTAVAAAPRQTMRQQLEAAQHALAWAEAERAELQAEIDTVQARAEAERAELQAEIDALRSSGGGGDPTTEPPPDSDNEI